MNIVLISSSALTNKKEATWLTLHSLAKEYVRHGHKVVISAEKSSLLPEIEETEGITVYRLHHGKIFAGRRSLQAITKSENIYFDIIHGFSSSPSLVLNTFLAGRKYPKAKTIHTIKSYSKYGILRTLFSGLLNLVDSLTVPTEKLRKSISNNNLQEKIKIISSPINVQKFKPRDREALKEKHGYKGKKIILYYGAIREEKGVDALIQAIPLIIKGDKEKEAEIEFIFAIRSNAVEKKEKYLAMARRLGCDKDINIILEDLPIEEYVSMADMVVLAYPSLIGTEGNPSCLLESMAAKTPVITTNLPELREIVEPEKDVLMAEPKDITSLALQINRLLKDQQLGKRLAENAYAKSKQFDVRIIARQYLGLYDGLNTNQPAILK
ncbi:MAG: glycosyltransferase family 4 protein [Nanoarchaeota archaeon]|nr:glycosyltransferase family 4 protein [Nanoarchaeota archaeon]